MSDKQIILYKQTFKNCIAEVNEFVYLGSLMSVDGSSDAEVKARLSKARHAFRTLRNFWRNQNISQHTKLRIYKTNVLSGGCLVDQQSCVELGQPLSGLAIFKLNSAQAAFCFCYLKLSI